MPNITRGNWSFRDPGDDIPDGAVIEGGNFSQHTADTPILVGKPLTIRGGNWVNVLRDVAWTVEGGNWARISRCSHLHPEWISKGLAECPVACPHVVGTDEIVVDGQVVDTIYHREDTVL